MNITLACVIALVNVGISDQTTEQLGRTWAAIYGVESSYRLQPPDGDHGKAVGPLQIQMCVLVDVNKRYGTHYTSQDRRDLSRSVELFVRYALMYEPKGNPEVWARLWNAGPRWQRKRNKCQEYWRRVQRELESQIGD